MKYQLHDNSTLDEIRQAFSHDLFATKACGCRVMKAGPGYAICEFDITDIHQNVEGNVMGGAIFTLADFALAIACNIGESTTVSVSNSIRYLNAAKGKKLIAHAREDKSGRTLGFYTIDVEDELGTKVAIMEATCFGRNRH